ncbi:circadian clock protein KaiC [Dankookia rubra]|uniref:non-specific serine/threonine protein kinase n=1 Tax=Dankookia rubra TaxID=1442381 RepID=A0A4R5QBM5_9PROT|nr:circadian clock protein KaiC [Dankookia rubra]TDH60502.1 circadian clock protein KaiC [Dankookia rubra]
MDRNVTTAPDLGAAKPLPKAPTGIAGFDDLTLGGLPRGRPTLVCGGAGCGKTLFAMTFLLNGIQRFDEAGVLMSFEEAAEDLAANVASLSYDVAGLIAEKRLVIDHVRIERSEIEEAGEYDLEGLFVRLGHAIDSIGARRVVLDTPEALFAGFSDEGVLRAELRRLFGWLKDRGVTAVITGERGAGQLTRHGLEEYVSDCVILLDNRVHDQVTTRRLRVIKYRGSAHGTNEYPFLIDEGGISVLPITSAGLNHKTYNEAVSTGVTGLDTMFGAGGYYRGSSVLISGGSGNGKTILAAHFAEAMCQRGSRCLYFGFEEGPDQLIRNVRSVGIDLSPHLSAGLLRFETARPSFYGLEMHLARMHRDIEQFAPGAVVVDPISAFRGPEVEVHATLLRMIDILKTRGITAVFTNLCGEEHQPSHGEHGLSSLMDTWISLRTIEADGERNRALYVLKSRGMAHSNQIREFVLTAEGMCLREIYTGPGGVLTGSARVAQATREQAEAAARVRDAARRRRQFETQKNALERQIADLQAALEKEAEELAAFSAEAEEHEAGLARDQVTMSASRRSAE